MTSRARRRHDEVSAAMASVRQDSCRDLISDIRNGATSEYQRVKRLKQNELNHRRVAGSAAAGPPSRAQKKKVDNHASAVASRSKQEFLVSQFEGLLRRKLAEAQVLSAACMHSHSVLSEQSDIIRAKDSEISKLRKQLDACQTQQNCSATPAALPNAPPAGVVAPPATTMNMPMPVAQHPYQRLPHYTAPVVLPPMPGAVPSDDIKFAQLKNERMHPLYSASLGSTQLSSPSVLPHPHLLSGGGALDGQDVGAAMDEIISPMDQSFNALQQPLAADAAILSGTLGGKTTAWRARLSRDDLVKADSTGSRMNPVA